MIPNLAKHQWRNVTDEWNAYLVGYQASHGNHLHGTLRGSISDDYPAGLDRMHCRILVVVPELWGKPFDLSGNRHLDFWDLHRVIALPYASIFRGGVDSVAHDDRLIEVVDHIVQTHNASLGGVQ